jgi:hypothetical protein
MLQPMVLRKNEMFYAEGKPGRKAMRRCVGFLD